MQRQYRQTAQNELFIAKMREGYKYGIWSISQKKIKSFHKNEKTAINFCKFEQSEKYYAIVPLSQLKFRILN